MSKIRAAFSGATQEILTPVNLVTDGVFVVTGAVLATVIGVTLPVIPLAAAGVAVVCVSRDALKGAYKGFKNG